MVGTVILYSSLVFAAFLVLLGVLYSIFSTRQLAKRRTQLAALQQSLVPGTEVLFSGGLTGTIVKFDNDEYVIVRLAQGLNIKISRYAITEVLSN